MNKRVVIYFLSAVLIFKGLFLSLFFFYAYSTTEIGNQKFGLGIGITSFIFLLAFFFRVFGEKKLHNLNVKDAILSVVLTWFIVVGLGAIPFLFFGVSGVDAIFESASGFTTTGATIFTDVESLPNSLLVWRSFSQWLGGMGIIVLFVAIIPSLGASGKFLFRSEIPGPIKENLTPQVRNTTKQLWIAYGILTVIIIITYKGLGMNWFDTINHAFTTVSTAGFSTKNESLGYFDPSVQWVAMAFMIISGVNFGIYLLLLTPNRKKIIKDTEFKFFILLIVITSIFFSLAYFMINEIPLFDSFRVGFFTIISFLTTTGYANADIAKFSFILQSLLLLFFFIGGCGGSTSGGIKIYRVLLIFRSLSFQIKKSLSPYLVSSVKIGKVKVDEVIIINSFVFILVYLFFFSIGSIFFFIDSGDFLFAYTFSASSLGNVGPVFGEVSFDGTYFNISSFSKLFSVFLMILGRLEIFTLLALLYPLFWKRY